MVVTQGNMAEFRFYRPNAREVFVVGDFNCWRDGECRMMQQEDGTWIARLFLPAGDFKFRYRADGQWFVDYAAFGIEQGAFGVDSVLRIAPAPRQAVPGSRRSSGAGQAPAADFNVRCKRRRDIPVS